MHVCDCMHVCVCVWGGGGGGGSTGGLVVGTPVYNTSGCEIYISSSAGVFFNHTTPQHIQLYNALVV